MSIPRCTLLGLAAILGTAGAHPGFASGLPPEIPVVWDLPAGWTARPMPVEGTGSCFELSGAVPEIYARAWVWPAEGGPKTPIDARRRLATELGRGWMLAGTVNRDGMTEVTFVGGSTGVSHHSAIAQALVGRVGVVDSELVAAAVFVPTAGGRESSNRAQELLRGCRFVSVAPLVDQWGNRLAVPAGGPSGAGQVAE